MVRGVASGGADLVVADMTVPPARETLATLIRWVRCVFFGVWLIKDHVEALGQDAGAV
jgi:hypothetical protein